MSPVSPVFHTAETESIGLKTNLRVGTSMGERERGEHQRQRRAL